jgi:hypothetical protein
MDSFEVWGTGQVEVRKFFAADFLAVVRGMTSRAGTVSNGEPAMKATKRYSGKQELRKAIDQMRRKSPTVKRLAGLFVLEDAVRAVDLHPKDRETIVGAVTELQERVIIEGLGGMVMAD